MLSIKTICIFAQNQNHYAYILKYYACIVYDCIKFRWSSGKVFTDFTNTLLKDKRSDPQSCHKMVSAHKDIYL